MVKVITPGVSPITLEVAKEHLRAFDGEDTIIALYINAAYTYAEEYLWRKISSTVVSETFSRWKQDLKLKYLLYSETSFTIMYRDINDAWQTLDAGLYIYDENCESIYTEALSELPEISTKRNSIKVQYTTGYENVPEDIIMAMLLMITEYYDERVDNITQIFNVNGRYHKSSLILLNNHRLNRFG